MKEFVGQANRGEGRLFLITLTNQEHL